MRAHTLRGANIFRELTSQLRCVQYSYCISIVRVPYKCSRSPQSNTSALLMIKPDLSSCQPHAKPKMG